MTILWLLGVLKTFKKELKQEISDMIDFTETSEEYDFEEILKIVDKIESIKVDVSLFDKITKKDEMKEKLFKKAIDKAYVKTDRATYQAMEAFIHNLNTMHSRAGAQVPFSSINFGTDTSEEGRMVLKNYLLSLESGLRKR